MRLPVHCCCEPSYRLGWLEVDDMLARRGPLTLLVPVPIRGGGRFWETFSTTIEYVQLAKYPATLLDCGHYTIQLKVRRLAVKSAEQPLEVWRKVPNFEAAL